MSDTGTGMSWNGWGDPERRTKLPAAVRALLPLMLGRLRRPAPAAQLDEVDPGPSALTGQDVQALSSIVGEEHVARDAESRIRHAGGKSTLDLLHRREHHQRTPDAVIRPADHAEVLAVLQAADRAGLAVVPFGGGTSVVGGVDPERGGHRAVLALDLTRLSGLLHLDEISGEATFGAGTLGPDAEAALAAHGLELGHYPQSFRYATLGGFAAARSSGQNSSGHGRFESMVTGLRAATPTGELELGRAPGSAAGPDLMRLFLGSEGAFGVITQVRVRVHSRPQDRVLEGWTFPDFATGVAALRHVVQRGAAPTVIRLSDESETRVNLAQVGRIGKAISKGASMVTVYEGEDVQHRRERAAQILSEYGGRSTGEGDGQGWLDGRFDGPYLRDGLLDAGVFCETLETATTYANLDTLRTCVTEALRNGFAAEGAKSYIMCHISHVYPTGASLYFTVIANLGAEPLPAWDRVKRATNDAIIAAGGTISHHHGVGRDHAPWLPAEDGEAGMRILAAVKRELDPRGIMNPGVLVPALEPVSEPAPSPGTGGTDATGATGPEAGAAGTAH